ncbi:Adenosine deaminase 2 [Lamellibrachia satsuma]|nr:Adenosine deaminase 2 [Lamellibrachia satsuma]
MVSVVPMVSMVFVVSLVFSVYVLVAKQPALAPLLYSWNSDLQIGLAQTHARTHVKRLYLKAMWQEAMADGVQYMETRKSLGGGSQQLYCLDADRKYEPTHGKRYLDPDGEVEINMILSLVRKFQNAHPDFIGFRRIINGHHRQTVSQMKANVNRVIKYHRKYPNHVVAFDIVGEEDAGYSLFYHVDALVELHDNATWGSAMPIFLHNAETSWPDDLMTSVQPEMDISSAQDNTLDAILLGVGRIGHGLGFIKRPYLLQLLKRRRVVIETCPTSNQLLGYVPDLRNHPAVHYLRSGIPVVLSSDDPGTFGYNHVTIDWYQAFMAWGLRLADLKLMALNSLRHSGMSTAERRHAIEKKWIPKWRDYIARIRKEACAMRTGLATVRFKRILPTFVPHAQTAAVHVFGSRFESGICETLKCKFGGKASRQVTYISNGHIICKTPSQNVGRRGSLTVPVSVSFDGGKTYLQTGLNFTYKGKARGIASCI